MGRHAARMGDVNTIFCVHSVKERDHSEDVSVYGRIILKQTLGK
jgi:hypothetical protein